LIRGELWSIRLGWISMDWDDRFAKRRKLEGGGSGIRCV
jgi:hypothetical protein